MCCFSKRYIWEELLYLKFDAELNEMGARKKSVERRQTKRYPVKNVSGIVGRRHVQVIDMSRAGLSFRYVQKDNIPVESIQLDIMSGLTDYCLDKLVGKVVADNVLTYETSFYPIIVRRCSLQLVDLTPDQMALLEKFIQDHCLDDE